MKLYYRSQAYDYDPRNVENKKPRQSFEPIHRSQRPYHTIYRGVTYHVNPATKSVAVPLPVAYKLIYRGIIYLVNKTAQGEVSIVTHPKF
ncbi:hypothetical protein AMR41_26735 [Hapalosiphon sp. MRB220]|nr:hypothetical protein AMR41_26735 [Hapalosiphon sp. MRB220]